MEFLGPQVMLWGGRILPPVLGAAAGYGYFRFIGCKSGACPLTSNPWISTLYGALIGALMIHS